MEEETTDGAYLQNSLISTLLYAPLYRIRTLLQTQDLIPTVKSSGRPFKGVFNCVKRIYKEEGLRSFWKGGIPLFLIVLYDEVFQIVQNEPLDDLEDESPKNIILDQTKNDSIPSNTDAFSQNENILEEKVAVGIISTTKIPEENPIAKPGLSLSVFLLLWRLAIHPFEVLRVRMASDFGTKLSRQYTGYFSAIKSLVKAGGIKSLFKGYIPLTLYAILDKNSIGYFERKDENGALNILDFLMVEAVIYPLSVISSRMMMVTGNPFVKYNGIGHCIKSTYKDFGIRGFYKGFQINLIFYALMIALNIQIEITDAE